ncbi:hypothetical protein, partial [uncultured Faecalicoccus sp.]|uniref:hypothetical protein n=1 Tax=uncultured Faecalicoccus sp. TaxID=1971760 RepID=UPI0025DB4A92
MAHVKEYKWLPYLMVLPAVAIMVLVVILPVIDTLIQSFHTADGAFTLDNYGYFLSSGTAFQSLIFTVEVALSVTFLSVAFSFLLVLYMRFSHSPISRFLSKIYLLPRFILGIAAVYAVMNVIKDSGFINRFLLLFGINFQPGLLYDMKGIIICNLWFSIPFAAMMLSAGFFYVYDLY